MFAVGLAVGLAFGFSSGLLFGLILGYQSGLLCRLLDNRSPKRGSTMDEGHPIGPRDILAQCRAFALLCGPTVGVICGFAAGIKGGTVAAFATGSMIWPAIGLHAIWGKLGLTRLWLGISHQAPFRLITFIEDAHDRGVLRQAGAVWEFRHANLQRYLAGPP